MRIKKIVGVLFAIVAGATALYFVTTAYFAKDERYQAAEAFVRGSPEVRAVVGEVSSVNLKRYVAVQASDISGSYRVYDLLVRGDKAGANVVVRATPKGSPAAYTFSIDSLDRY